jgi:hypothetical protein
MTNETPVISGSQIVRLYCVFTGRFTPTNITIDRSLYFATPLDAYETFFQTKFAKTEIARSSKSQSIFPSTARSNTCLKESLGETLLNRLNISTPAVYAQMLQSNVLPQPIACTHPKAELRWTYEESHPK